MIPTRLKSDANDWLLYELRVYIATNGDYCAKASYVDHSVGNTFYAMHNMPVNDLLSLDRLMDELRDVIMEVFNHLEDM